MDVNEAFHAARAMMVQSGPNSWLFDAHTPNRKKVLELARRAAPSSCPLLILGGSGVGKEVLATDVHRHSTRAQGPFISVNSAAIAPQLFESAFFGHLRGSFTGAMADKPGFIEMAHGGTLFLDEVAELHPETQAKLLRFLSLGTYWPIGSHTERHADVRIIAATHRNIEDLKGGVFREDLFYRLSVIVLRIPPLEREDVAGIARTMARHAMVRHGRSLSDGDIETIANHCVLRRWPGGAREVRNLIDRIFVLWDGQMPLATHCVEMLEVTTNSQPNDASPREANGAAMKDLENLVFLAIAAESQDVRELARRTERTVQTVYWRLKKLGVDPRDIGPTPVLTQAIERLQERIAPELPWIQALLRF
jgi:transcriptional regulator with PAS, ATPase and Fis domain